MQILLSKVVVTSHIQSCAYGGGATGFPQPLYPGDGNDNHISAIFDGNRKQ